MDLINQNLIIVLYGYSEQLISLDQLKHWSAGNVRELAESPSPLDRMLLNQSQGGMCICRGLGRGLGVPQ